MSTPVTRREFLGTTSKTAAGVAAGAAVHTMLRDAQAADANERHTVALIGCGGMGRYKLGNFMDSKQCDVAAVCDPDDAHMEGAAGDVENKLQTKPDLVKDYRKVLDNKDIDIVIIGTPDHWHAAIMMAAVAAGKDVYCEKPCSHNILEAKYMVEAAEKYKKMVQVGTHQRSSPHIQEARAFVQDGELGIISQTNTYTYGNESPDGMGEPEIEPVPPGVDYDLWLGPAEKRKFNRHRFHRNWRWFFDYAAGMVGDWNVHLQDIVMWTLGVKAPISVCCVGGKYVLEDDRTTPDTMQVVYEFGPCDMAPNGFTQTFTMRKASGRPWDAGGYGMDFHGTNGFMHVTREGWKVEADMVNWKKPQKGWRLESFEEKGRDSHWDHVEDFLNCLASGKSPIASIEKHYHTVVACHLANVSYRVQRQIFWDAEKVMCFKDRELKVPDTEANKYLGREYRKGYELPDVL